MKKILSILLILLLLAALALPMQVLAAPTGAAGVTWSVELFTIGGGYLVAPVQRTAAQKPAEALLRLLTASGYVGYYDGTPQSGFYLAFVGDGTQTKKYQGRANSAALYGTPTAPKTLNITPKVPAPLKKELASHGFALDEQALQGRLGEYQCTKGGGWLFSVNGAFPSTSLADVQLKDGDVVRVQFSLANGADIGGATPAANNFYPVAHKDQLTRALATADKNTAAYRAALSCLQTLDATQTQVDAALSALQAAGTPTATATRPVPTTVGECHESSTQALPSSASTTPPTSVSLAPTTSAPTTPSSIPATTETTAPAVPDLFADLWTLIDEDEIVRQAGTAVADWTEIGLARLGVAQKTAAYLAALLEYVQARYKEPDKLSATKATEWHRIALAVLACGGDPTHFGTDADGQPIDLIADGTYNHPDLGKQGINGWIWALITLDAAAVAQEASEDNVPENARTTRGEIIVSILDAQLPDGGFALSGDGADADITAMALQALAPYFTNNKRISVAVGNALTCLSRLQSADGDLCVDGVGNPESTCQAIMALRTAAIPLDDARFVKNGHTLLDGLSLYRTADGGFAHTRDGARDVLTEAQVLLALTPPQGDMTYEFTVYLPPEKDPPNDWRFFVVLPVMVLLGGAAGIFLHKKRRRGCAMNN
ncbi:MAG: hypothetical protein LBN05_02180 [Oscillospiraceae bacterium]|jgi:hypothetical protein|nr:hypothetical protein [Oscillospiraceae bacterium]